MLICTPKLAERATKLYADDSIPLHYRITASGTASTEMRDILGLDSTEKAALISIMPHENATDTLSKLRRGLKIGSTNSGIAFTVPVTALSTLALRIMESAEPISESNDKRRSTRMDNKYALITAIVNQGYSENLMEAARAAGAAGGTVIHSHSVGNEAISGAWGFAIEDEREIVLIVADKEQKLAIMQAISDACGIKSAAKGIVLSLPIEEVIGLGD